MKILLKKLLEYFQAHNYNASISHEVDMYGIMYLSVSYKKVETRFYFNKTQLIKDIRNMTYKQFEKYIEKIALKCLYDITK